MCQRGDSRRSPRPHPLSVEGESAEASVAPLSLRHLGSCLWLHWVSPSLAGPQMLCLSRRPEEGKVSPFQPSSPLELLAANSGGPPFWRLETVQSGAFGVLVAHEQTPRQPPVPRSGEALKPQSQQRKCGLQAALIPCRGVHPSTKGGEPGPNPERRNPGSSVGVRKLCCRDQDPPFVRFCPSTSRPRCRSFLLMVTAPTAAV